MRPACSSSHHPEPERGADKNVRWLHSHPSQHTLTIRFRLPTRLQKTPFISSRTRYADPSSLIPQNLTISVPYTTRPQVLDLTVLSSPPSCSRGNKENASFFLLPLSRLCDASLSAPSQTTAQPQVLSAPAAHRNRAPAVRPWVGKPRRRCLSLELPRSADAGIALNISIDATSTSASSPPAPPGSDALKDFLASTEVPMCHLFPVFRDLGIKTEASARAELRIKDELTPLADTCFDHITGSPGHVRSEGGERAEQLARGAAQGAPRNAGRAVHRQDCARGACGAAENPRFGEKCPGKVVICCRDHWCDPLALGRK
jgi:hypothetical protein